MNVTFDNYQEPLRRIADEFMAANKRAAKKPLRRVQEYLEALEECTDKLIKFLLKVEKLAVVTAFISFFVWGAIRLLIELHA